MSKPSPILLRSFDELLRRLDALCADGSRRMLGLVGPPGAGKTTVAQRLLAANASRAAIVPMDGFHLANSELRRLGRSGRKGAPDTFDSAGYVALLRRLREQRSNEVVYAPEFRREIEEAIAGAIPIVAPQRLIITEGNYLLSVTDEWKDVRAILDEIWYVEVDDAVRRDRLLARHVRFGRTDGAARDWVTHTDEPNALLIASTRSYADAIVGLAAETPADRG